MSSTSAGGQQATPSTPRKDTPRLPSLDGIEWRVAHGLLVTLFALTQAYVARGSPREAEYFAQQAKDVAESLNTPAMIGKSLARIGEIYLHLHQVEDSHASLAKAADYAAGTAGPDAAEIHRLRAEHNRLHADGKEAPQLYDEAMAMLEELDKVFAALDGQVTRWASLFSLTAVVLSSYSAPVSLSADRHRSRLAHPLAMKYWHQAYSCRFCARVVSQR